MALQDGFPARGQDVLVRLKVDGVHHRYDFPSVEIDWGLDVAMSEFVGDTVARPYGQNRPARLRLTLEPKHRGFHDLVLAQRNANGPNATRKDVAIDVVVTTDYGPGGKPRWAFNGCVLSAPTQSQAGPADKARNTCELTCAEPTPI